MAKVMISVMQVYHLFGARGGSIWWNHCVKHNAYAKFNRHKYRYSPILFKNLPERLLCLSKIRLFLLHIRVDSSTYVWGLERETCDRTKIFVVSVGWAWRRFPELDMGKCDENVSILCAHDQVKFPSVGKRHNEEVTSQTRNRVLVTCLWARTGIKFISLKIQGLTFNFSYQLSTWMSLILLC